MVLEKLKEGTLKVIESLPLSLKTQLLDSQLYYHLVLLYLLCGGTVTKVNPNYSSHSFKQHLATTFQAQIAKLPRIKSQLNQ